jgi:alkylhydroperoxidase/carboxymuconolactone decarboxylase family protein YurZ
MAENEEKKTRDVLKYVDEKMYFVPRFLKSLAPHAPEVVEKFAGYYEEGKKDGHLKRKDKELIFTAIGIATASPRCIVHVIPAIRAGASHGEVVEAVLVGLFATGFYPNNVGIPYSAEYAQKVLEIDEKYRKGEPWEYLVPEEYRG